MSVSRSVAIVGIAEAQLENGKLPLGETVLQIQAKMAKQALDDAGFTKDDVNGLFVAGAWGIPGPGIIGSGIVPTLTLSEYLGIKPGYAESTQIGGASFEAHVGHAAAAMQAGLCDVALVLFGSTQRSEKLRTMKKPAALTDQYESVWGLPSPLGSYALAAQRHMFEYGTTSEQLAEIAVSAREWAKLNPNATKRESLTVKDVLESPLIADPLHILDCCLVTDGAGALVLASTERARDSKRKPVWLLGYGESQTHLSIGQMPDLTITPAKDSGKRAFGMAGVSHEEIDLLEIYDSFTITVLLTLESLGFCAPGEGGSFVSNQRTAPNGSLPMNTNGGGLSYAHPGMFGIFLLIEAVRQLRGEAGERQVNNAKLALVNGTGGVLSSSVTCILGRN